MGNLSQIRCTTPRCIDSITKYGNQYHRVYDFNTPLNKPKVMPTAIAHCESCGGYTDGTTWKHVCEKCGKDVQSGELCGLFVPHLCRECEQAIADKDKRTGNICLKCRVVRSRCCC